MEKDVLVRLENICMTFYQKTTALHVLDKINLSLHKGEILALLGPSGGGKSTILNIISGLLDPSCGHIERKGEIGYMFQRDQLLDWRNIYDNILLGLEIQKSLTAENRAKVDRLLKTYGLWDFRQRYPHELSGGMRQREMCIRDRLRVYLRQKGHQPFRAFLLQNSLQCFSTSGVFYSIPKMIGIDNALFFRRAEPGIDMHHAVLGIGIVLLDALMDHL